MDFDFDKDFSIFSSLLEKRPEINSDKLKEDLKIYYLPYLKKLVDLKNERNSSDGIIVGVSAIQGTGKTTQGEILEVLMSHFGHSTVSLSIDDHYITHKQLCELRNNDPRFIRRGVTHDIDLAKRDLKKLKKMASEEKILISGYDKGAQSGDGDRFAWINIEEGLEVKLKVIEQELMVNKKNQKVNSLKILSASFNNIPLIILDNMGTDVPVVEKIFPDSLIHFLNVHQDKEIVLASVDGDNAVFYGTQEVKVSKKDLPKGWRLISKKPDFIFYDGWMVGARAVEDDSVFDSGLPALETEEAKEFARFVNKKLADYETLWNMFDFLTVLYVPNFQDSLKWRDQAEEALRVKGEGMSHDEIREFVYYFWRSVHPGIHIKNLAYDTNHTDLVVIINDDHTIKEVLTPENVKQSYV